MSATILSVEQYLISISLLFTFSLMKWNLTSMCFDLSFLIGLFEMLIVDWLSSKIKIGSFDSSNLPREIASLTEFESAIYSASVELKATIDCFFYFQLIAPKFFRKTYPPVLFLSFESLAKLASEYPNNFCLFFE